MRTKAKHCSPYRECITGFVHHSNNWLGAGITGGSSVLWPLRQLGYCAWLTSFCTFSSSTNYINLWVLCRDAHNGNIGRQNTWLLSLQQLSPEGKDPSGHADGGVCAGVGPHLPPADGVPIHRSSLPSVEQDKNVPLCATGPQTTKVKSTIKEQK